MLMGAVLIFVLQTDNSREPVYQSVQCTLCVCVCMCLNTQLGGQ